VGDVVSIPMKLFRKELSLVLGCFSVFIERLWRDGT
jgi:hypothetical protein